MKIPQGSTGALVSGLSYEAGSCSFCDLPCGSRELPDFLTRRDSSLCGFLHFCSPLLCWTLPHLLWDLCGGIRPGIMLVWFPVACVQRLSVSPRRLLRCPQAQKLTSPLCLCGDSLSLELPSSGRLSSPCCCRQAWLCPRQPQVPPWKLTFTFQN